MYWQMVVTRNMFVTTSSVHGTAFWEQATDVHQHLTEFGWFYSSIFVAFCSLSFYHLSPPAK